MTSPPPCLHPELLGRPGVRACNYLLFGLSKRSVSAHTAASGGSPLVLGWARAVTMPYFPLQPRSACSSKDTAQPTCLQVHFVLFSKDLFLAPVLCSASNWTFSAAQHIKLGIWFTWEKNALCSPIYSSAGSVSQRGPLDRHRNTSASLGTGLLWGQEQAAGGQGCVLRQISSFNQISICLFLHQCLPSGKSRNKGQRKKSLAAAWSWIDLIKPTSITKGKEKEETYQLLTVILFFQENHLKRLGSWTPSNDHDLVNLWGFFFLLLLCQTW